MPSTDLPGPTPTPETAAVAARELAPPSASERVAHALGWLNLIYAGALPAAATFSALYLYGSRISPLVIFLGGLLSVVTYLAVVIKIAPVPSSPAKALLLVVDGPLFAYASLPTKESYVALAIQGFLVDGLSFGLVLMWMYVGIVRDEAHVQTKDDMTGCVGAILIAVVAGMVFPFLGYIRADLIGHWESLGILVVGLGWSTVTHARELDPGLSQRDLSKGGTVVWMIGMSFLWIGAMFAGNGLHR